MRDPHEVREEWRWGEQNRQMQEKMDDEEDVKERVMWVVRALVDACKRHDYAARELVRERLSLVRLRMSDKGGEGVVEIDERGLEESRKGSMSCEGCRVPRVGVRVKMEVDGEGVVFEGATLVLVRAVEDEDVDEEDGDNAAMEAFGVGKYKGPVMALMKGRSYSPEMNSFLI